MANRGVFTLTDPGVHNPDPAVHDPDLPVHITPIPVFTFDRSGCSRCSEIRSFQQGDIAGGLASVLNLASGLATTLQQPPATGVANVAGGDGIGGGQAQGQSVVEEAARKGVSLGKTTVDLSYTTIDGIPFARHGFLIVTGPDRQRIGVRAGPAARSVGLGSPASSGGDGIFGALTTQVAELGPDFIDSNAAVVASQQVLVTDRPFSEIVGALRQFSNQVNAAGIRYNPLGANSNAFAHQAVTVLGVPRPPPIVFAPGARMVLRLP